MIGDFYQTPLMKNSWIFQNIKDNVKPWIQLFYANIMKT
jgi:hypothetical protein